MAPLGIYLEVATSTAMAVAYKKANFRHFIIDQHLG